jgi:CBS domain containing-hemolysin-like protein
MITLLLLLPVLVTLYLTYLFKLVAAGLYLSDYDEQRFLSSLKPRKQVSVTFLLRNPHRVAVAAMVVETLSLGVTTILLFMIGARLVTHDLFGYLLGAVLALVGWFLHLTLAEMLAPAIKQERALHVIRRRLWLTRAVMALVSPFVSLVLRHKERRDDEADREERKEEIIERAIEVLADSAGIDEPLVEREERRMIENIFELGQTEVREVMVPRIEMVAIEVGSSFEEVQRIAIESGYSRFPLYKEDADNIKGIIYLKDIFQAMPFTEDGWDLVRLSRKPYFVPESKRLGKLLEEFKLQRNHMAIVVDEFGGTAGLVTMEDLLEMIVGDIQDEHDTEEADLVRLSENAYMVSANLSMEDLSERLKLSLEEKDFETVGGYIYDLVGSLPDVGDQIDSDGLRFIVEKIKGQRIEKVKLILMPDRQKTQEQ